MNSEAWDRLLATIGKTVTDPYPDTGMTNAEVGRQVMRDRGLTLACGHKVTSVRIDDLVELMRAYERSKITELHLGYAEKDRDEILGLILKAQKIMEGEGRTDVKLRQAGRELGLVNASRPLKNWHQIADEYWELRFGIPPDGLGGPVDPLSLEEAQIVMMERHCQAGETFDSLVKGCQRAGLDMSLKRNHPNWKEQEKDK